MLRFRRRRHAPARPDYLRIDQLERELGIAGEDEQPIRPSPSKVCLRKNCDGQTEEVRTWSGQLMFRAHVH